MSRKARSGAAAPTSELARLRSHERDLERLLGQTRDRGAAVVAEAREDARRRSAEAEVALQAEAERVRASIRADTRERSQALLSEARQRVGIYEETSDERVRELADGVFRRLLAGPSR